MSPPCPIRAANSSSPTWRGRAAGPSATASTRPARSAEVEYQLENGGASYFLAENQEFVDKALQAEGGLRQVRKIIVFDTRALFQYRDERLISFEEVVDAGA